MSRVEIKSVDTNSSGIGPAVAAMAEELEVSTMQISRDSGTHSHTIRGFFTGKRRVQSLIVAGIMKSVGVRVVILHPDFNGALKLFFDRYAVSVDAVLDALGIADNDPRVEKRLGRGQLHSDRHTTHTAFFNTWAQLLDDLGCTFRVGSIWKLRDSREPRAGGLGPCDPPDDLDRRTLIQYVSKTRNLGRDDWSGKGIGAGSSSTGESIDLGKLLPTAHKKAVTVINKRIAAIGAADADACILDPLELDTVAYWVKRQPASNLWISPGLRQDIRYAFKCGGSWMGTAAQINDLFSALKTAQKRLIRKNNAKPEFRCTRVARSFGINADSPQRPSGHEAPPG